MLKAWQAEFYIYSEIDRASLLIFKQYSRINLVAMFWDYNFSFARFSVGEMYFSDIV